MQGSVNHLDSIGHPHAHTIRAHIRGRTRTLTLTHTPHHSNQDPRDPNHGFRYSCGADGLVGGNKKTDA